MARLLKCQYCGKKDVFTEETMVKHENVTSTGKTQNKYFHKECYEPFKKEQAKKQAESKRLDKLVQMAGSIHELEKSESGSYILPRMWYHTIQDWRNGTQRYTMNFKKKYKKGIPYQVLTEAYKQSQDAIKWSKLNKNFDSVKSEIRYGMAIVNNKIPDAMKKLKQEKMLKEKNEKTEKDRIEMMELERDVNYKDVKKDSEDMTDILGDW